MENKQNSDSMGSPLLTVENLEVNLDTSKGLVQPVKGISFSVGRGEIIGIVGESGSGKSITCRSILGLLPYYASTQGKVVFDNQNLVGLPEKEFRKVRGEKISMIFQNPASHLNPLINNSKLVAEALEYHHGKTSREARAEAIELFKAVGINDAENRATSYPHELSGGMKQRVMIASAMACRPQLLLADEPTTALDVTVQATILELLKDLNKKYNLSIILVSHDLAVIAEICQRVVVMKDGKIVEQGTTSEIIKNPQETYTKMLIESQPSVQAKKHQARTQQKEEAQAERFLKDLIKFEKLKVYFETPKTLLDLILRREAKVVKAVDGISFSVKQGEIYGIVGESGSGKSTVARAFIKLITPSSGEILFKGESVVSLKGEALKQFRLSVQMIFQNPFDSLSPRYTIGQTIAEPLLKHGLVEKSECDKRVNELMDLVELPLHLKDRRPRQLSGGQCQRVGIARALAMEPEVLIADEVTSALDVTIQAQILELLERLREKVNLTIIYISHDLAVVEMFCNRVAVFREGKLVEEGPVEQVLNHPKEEYTKNLVASAPKLETAV